MICGNLTVIDGVLHFAGQDVTKLAKEYGTPLYLMDENKIRENCRAYKKALDEYVPGSMALYASKACSFKKIYEIVGSEGLGVDAVSLGEIYTAKAAGFDMANIYFQGNNKTDFDIATAMEWGVGYFVCDNAEEVDAISRIASDKGITQKLLLRLTPGIDPHTYDEVATGRVDSKFGTAIETGQAEEILAHVIKLPNISVEGIHCHVGSMVFESSVFVRSACVMLEFLKQVHEKYNYSANILDLGGGYGVRYTSDDPYIDVYENVKEVCLLVSKTCNRLGLDMPKLRFEPGRSIVADAGLTLYTVGTVKKITGYKNYVSVDGGMTDNPRYALYGSKYTVYTANKADSPALFKADLVGRCCESGDIIQPNIDFPEDITRGDIVAVATTGAYNYSMASNYNRLARPAVVMLDGNDSYIAVERESLEDIIRLDK